MMCSSVQAFEAAGGLKRERPATSLVQQTSEMAQARSDVGHRAESAVEVSRSPIGWQGVLAN
jgi:hypothetical protein